MSEKYTHLRCPRYPLCQNDEVDSRVFQCKHGHVFCEQCAKQELNYWIGPECERDELVFAGDYIGRISNSSVEDEEWLREDMVAELRYCRHCLCNTSGTRVYQCNDDHIFCEACQYKYSGHQMPLCPMDACNHMPGKAFRHIGTII